MPATLLYYTYGFVMLASLACFLMAYRRRFDTPVHRRWGILGVSLTLAGILVVIVVTYFFDQRVEQRFPLVVVIHRRLALASTALVLFVAFTGMRRMRIHTKLYLAFLPLYVATVATALVGYQP